jgi:hypothetical protein
MIVVAEKLELAQLVHFVQLSSKLQKLQHLAISSHLFIIECIEHIRDTTMEPPGPPPTQPTVMQTCSLADCFKPATSDQRLPWKPNGKQRQRSALLADFEKDGYYLCADHR